MSFSAQYPPVLTEAGDLTSGVLAKFNSEFQYLYVTLLSRLFSAGLGHGHTGNGSDGPQLSTASLLDNAVTTPKIANANVTTDKIADSNVTTAKIANGAITADKLAGDAVSTNGYTPIGGIIMWSGAIVDIPANWHICDGYGGTPNLIDRFVIGAGYTYAPFATGGEATHTLTEAEMPSHTHSTGQSLAGSSNMGFPGGGTLAITTTTGATGGGQAHNNLPPFYALAFIMRVS